MTALPRVVIDPREFDAVIFDMDGVVTETTHAHKSAWKKVFDEFLHRTTGARAVPFDVEDDYLRYVDGKPRYDGVRSFLASRGIQVPEGTRGDSPKLDTVCGIGNRKNEAFAEHISSSGVDAYPTTVELIHHLHRAGLRTALITSSRNAEAVLDAASARDLFEVVIDGEIADRRGLPGKPSPAVFLAAAADLGVSTVRCIVIEDAIAGVRAGRDGGFGLVVGVARSDNAADLMDGGADVVVNDLGELSLVS